ncbi:MAG TPA: TIGR04283 family arsenosugar biosynthesis glycosyltransferase [Verrucomicrobiae bacterium]|nr:TIGR04283 family arsenosugar biosynthesis glycosyltransferase [Verrucomicrobiae bacterium]
MKISVIIPALNEARELPETIARISGAAEIIVADGGSDDRTQDFKGVTVIQAPRGRASQMNAGAAIAKGDVFLFLHADTWLRGGALDSISRAMEDSEVVGGAFQRWFRTDSIFLKATCALATFRNRAIGWHLGDQGIFCRSEIFRGLGGFANMRALEDVDFSRRMGRKGRLVTLGPAVLTSARRFEEGALRRTAKDLVLTARYLLRPKSFRV